MIEEVLTQAQQIGMISEDFYYLLTSLDAHTVDLHSFKVLKTGSINPKKQGLLGGVFFGEMKFALSIFFSNEDLSISYKS